MKTAVLVIDVQQGLCEGEGKAHDCAGVIANINRVTQQARAANAPVIFIQHESTAGNSALTPQQVIAHHNATLTNISSFGPRVTATPCGALKITPSGTD
jgi:nicotinamidase-related amidase